MVLESRSQGSCLHHHLHLRSAVRLKMCCITGVRLHVHVSDRLNPDWRCFCKQRSGLQHRLPWSLRWRRGAPFGPAPRNTGHFSARATRLRHNHRAQSDRRIFVFVTVRLKNAAPFQHQEKRSSEPIKNSPQAKTLAVANRNSKLSNRLQIRLFCF